MTTPGQRMIRDGIRRLRALLFPRRPRIRRGLYLDPPTSIERKIQRELSRCGIHYVVHPHIGPYVPDIYLPQYRVVIECDGDYWHSLAGRREHDDRRDRWFAAHGFRTFRLAEYAINRSPDGCVELIRKALA